MSSTGPKSALLMKEFDSDKKKLAAAEKIEAELYEDYDDAMTSGGWWKPDPEGVLAKFPKEEQELYFRYEAAQTEQKLKRNESDRKAQIKAEKLNDRISQEREGCTIS